ncbi:Hydroxamate-type ferrichrome siderophore peptide synthetase [Frankliniella fusca]|uniref:Hydroxamate-type ferrichrome siderophore peptide synthetase n=1 Tax=Frankliniella fusca TaxID=407009 RepID=A0AAE1GQ27_9NEOP|nr:Hydroxamate-type ferrichrome siderophore peptide synthetase [Frankliniella fusca]
MALKFVILALAVGACAAELSKVNRQELKSRVEACTAGVPGKGSQGSFFEGYTPVDECINAATDSVTNPNNNEPNKVITSLPLCLKNANVKAKDVAPVTSCLQTSLPKPFTFIDGNNDYATLDNLWHMFALEDCLGSDSQLKACKNLQYDNFARHASVDDVISNLAECLKTTNAPATVLSCFSSEVKDPAVKARAVKYMADNHLYY